MMTLLQISLPSIDPIAFHLGPLSIHWYGIMYMLSFLLIYFAMLYSPLGLTKNQISDYIFIAALSVIIGGRIGYVLFYNLVFYLENPLHTFFIWEGGMSFHGGLAGVVLATVYFCRSIQISFWKITDYIVMYIPITLALGRIGNFINGELYGRLSNLPWAMQFSTAPGYRHPSQLYEALLHIFTGIFLLKTQNTTHHPKTRSAIFLMSYGIIRIIVEIFRQPDEQIGFLFTYFTMGQILSLPILLAGIYLYSSTRRASHKI